jgi:flagellar biosynthesis/type III secretory pathway protein FliH
MFERASERRDATLEAVLAMRPASLAALFTPPIAVPLCVPVPEVKPDIAAITGDAQAQGFAAGHAAATAELLPIRALLIQSAQRFDAACVIDINLLRAPFKQLLQQICETVMAAELRLAPELLLAMVDGALASILPDNDTVLRLHPDDLARFEPQNLPLATAADPLAEPGSVRIETPHFVIADSFAARLAALLEASQSAVST